MSLKHLLNWLEGTKIELHRMGLGGKSITADREGTSPSVSFSLRSYNRYKKIQAKVPQVSLCT